MKEDTEFSHIGKGNPYAVPTGFFEEISEKTLQKAIMREQLHRKNNVRRIIVSVAASVAVLLFLGYHFGVTPGEKGKPGDFSQETTRLGPTVPPDKTVTPNQVAPQESIALNPKEALAKDNSEPGNHEGFNDLLARMSDDELLEVAALTTPDPFNDETEQN